MADSIVLWTRVTPVDANPVSVNWELSTTSAFTTLQASGTASAQSAQDYTVKIIPSGLTANTTYYFRFSVTGSPIVSPVGKTKTLPTGPNHLPPAAARIGTAGTAQEPHSLSPTSPIK